MGDSWKERERAGGEPGTELAVGGGTEEVPGDRAKDRNDKIRGTGSYRESWVEGRSLQRP